MGISYIYGDSTNRSEPGGNSYTLYLTSHIKNVKQIDLVSVSVPNVMCNITDGSNVITLNTTNYSLPIGNYTAYELAATITTYVNILCDWIPFSSGGRFLFSSTDPFTVSFNTPEIRKRLGMNVSHTSVYSKGTAYESYCPQNVSIVYSSGSPDLTVSQFQFLDIEEFRNSGFIDSKKITWNNGVQSYSSSVARTFAAIPVDVTPLGIKSFSESKDFKYSVYFDNLPVLSRLTVRWIDSDGNLLNFAGLERNSFVLRVYTDDGIIEHITHGTDGFIKYITVGVILFLIFLLVSF